MATEKYCNLAKTTLTANYTAGDGHIDVSSTGAPFPSSAQFRLIITNTNEDTIKVVLKVTSITSSTRWAVTAEGTDANASSGDHVIGTELTKGALDQIFADNAQSDTFANLPSTERAGRIFIPQDSIYTLIRDNGTTWDYFKDGAKVTPPPAVSGLSWVNQGSATAVETFGGIIIKAPSSGSVNHRMLVKSKTGNYTFTIGIQPIGFQNNFFHMGMVIRESSTGKFSKYGPWGLSTGGLSVDNYTNATTYSGTTPKSQQGWWNIKYLQVVKDSTNYTFYAADSISVLGTGESQFYQVAVASLFSGATFDQIGITVDTENSQDLGCWFFHWLEA